MKIIYSLEKLTFFQQGQNEGSVVDGDTTAFSIY